MVNRLNIEIILFEYFNLDKKLNDNTKPLLAVMYCLNLNP